MGKESAPNITVFGDELEDIHKEKDKMKSDISKLTGYSM